MKRVLLVDFLVGRQAGHVAEYLGFLRSALTSVHPDELTPYLRGIPPRGRLDRYRLFVREMWQSFRRGDVVVFHTPEARDILVLSALTLLPGARRGRAVMMMRRGAEIFVGRHDWRARLLARLVRALVSRGVLRLVSDSHSAARTWEAITGRPVPTIPLPVRAPLVAGRARRRCEGPIQVTLLGLFRQEKGIDRYEAVLRVTRELDPDARLYCQVADHPTTALEREVTEAVRQMYGSDPAAEVHAGHLAAEEYDRALLASDVVVLPYEPALYTSGTSGLLFDALSAGAVVASTRIRWGVEEFGDSPSIVWLEGRDDAALRAGLREALERARRRRAEGVPSDLPSAEAFARGWMGAIRDAAEG